MLENEKRDATYVKRGGCILFLSRKPRGRNAASMPDRMEAGALRVSLVSHASAFWGSWRQDVTRENGTSTYKFATSPYRQTFVVLFASAYCQTFKVDGCPPVANRSVAALGATLPKAGEGYPWIVPPRLSRTTGKRTKSANCVGRAASLGEERIAPLQGGGGGYLGARAGICVPLKIGGVCALHHFIKTKGGANELSSARAKAGGRTRSE